MAPHRTSIVTEPEPGRIPLPPCPGAPNCVCSERPGTAHSVDPWSFAGDPAAAWHTLVNLIARQPRTRIVSQSDSYLHAECRTALLRFVDDLEFRLDPTASAIHVRSESRLGYSDFGVNRRRVQTLHDAWAEQMRSPG